MNIAVDAMGGDHAPEVVVQGALQAAHELGVNITLVGNKRALQDKLNGHPGKARVDLHHCEEVVLMDEAPLKAVRRRVTFVSTECRNGW